MTDTEEALRRLELQAQQSRSHASLLQEVRGVEASLRALDLACEVWVATDVFGFNVGYVRQRGDWRIVVGQQFWSNPFTGIPRRKLLLDADRVECARAVPKLGELLAALETKASAAFKPGRTD